MTNRVPEHEANRRRAKKAIKDHWLEAGRWKEFIEVRESLKGAGLAPDEAWQEADRRLVEGYELPSTPAAQEDSTISDGVAKVVENIELKGQVSAEAFAKESVSTADTVRWVASYLMVADAEPGDAPSSEAWGMLQWAKRNNTNEASFWSTIWRQLMPTKQSLEAETRFSDDGKPILDLISRIKQVTETDNGGSSDVSGDE